MAAFFPALVRVGNLDIINEAVERERADAVLHCGDFGFYTDTSLERLEDRELLAEGLTGPALRRWVREHTPLSQLPEYTDGPCGTKRFAVPVYAIWGNHEDPAVVAECASGALRVPNLHVLTEHEAVRLGRAVVCGLGGNWLPERGFDRPPLAGRGGKVWSTLAEMGGLLRTAKSIARHPDDELILLTHCSPGKEPSLARLACALRCAWAFSGHMGPPYAQSWHHFAVRTPAETRAFLAKDARFFAPAAAQFAAATSRTSPELQPGVSPAPAPEAETAAPPATSAGATAALPEEAAVAAATTPARMPPPPGSGEGDGDWERDMATRPPLALPAHPWWTAPGAPPDAAACVGEALAMLGTTALPVPAAAQAAGGKQRAEWLMRPTFVNLPDAPYGYAVLVVPASGPPRLRTVSTAQTR